MCVQKEGANYRRQRLLFVTPRGGARLEARRPAVRAVSRARLTELGPNAHEAACRFLVAMIDVDNREGVLRFIAGAGRARRPRS